MSKPKAGDPLTILPVRTQNTTHLVWRKVTVGYNAPARFFKVFGRHKLTLAQIRAIAEKWLEVHRQPNFREKDFFEALLLEHESEAAREFQRKTDMEDERESKQIAAGEPI